MNVKVKSVTRQRFPGQPDFIGRLVRDAFNLLTAEVNDQVMRSYPGVSPGQTRVMVLIDPEGTRPAELARRADVTRQSMAEALAGLQALGLVSVTRDPDDGRAKIAVLTKAGWEAAREGLKAALAVHAHWEDVLGTAKMNRLMGLLKELLDGLRGEAAESQ